ncbi:MAG: NUDIX hydrolase [Actinomycetota bacterium]
MSGGAPSPAAAGPASPSTPGRDRGRWINHGTINPVYESWWVKLTIDDVERPDGRRVEHEVLRGPNAAGMVVVDPDRGMLMIWRHRFMPDVWGWEIPGGAVDDGESAETAARRECLEETGWEVTGPVDHLSRHHPSCGLIAQTFDLYLADAAEHRGDPEDTNEAALVEWRPLDRVAADLRAGLVPDAFTQLGVALALARSGRADLLAGPLTIDDTPSDQRGSDQRGSDQRGSDPAETPTPGPGQPTGPTTTPGSPAGGQAS